MVLRVVLCLLLVGFATARARADAPSFQLPADCDRGTFDRALGRYLDRAEGELAPGEALAIRVRAHGSGFDLALRIRTVDGRRASRTLRHRSRCDVLLESAALVSAFVLDPVRAEQARDRAEDAQAAAPDAEPTSSDVAVADPETSTVDAGLAPLGAAGGAVEAERAPEIARASASETAEPSVAQRVEDDQAASRRAQLVVLGGVRSGLLGRASPVLVAALEVRVARRGRVGGRLDASWPSSVGASGSARVVGGAIMMGAEACVMAWEGARVAIAGCLGAGAGVMRAHGVGFDQNFAALRAVAYGAGGLDARVAATRRVAVRARLDATVWAVRPRFAVEPAAFEATVRRASVGGSVGLEVRL